MESQFLRAVRDRKKLITIAVHVLVWLVVFLLPYFVNPDYEPSDRGRSKATTFRDLNTVTKIFWLALFYFNAGILVPRLVYKRKFVVYLLSLLGLFAVIMLFHGLLFHLMIDGLRFKFLHSAFYNSFPFVVTVVLSIAYEALSDQIRFAEKQNENLKTELSFLRSQISPHFLLNVMNNIVALVRLRSEELEPTVMKLSGLMQYMLYETDEEKVLIRSEVEYLQNYIDLQKQRFGSELKLNVSFDVKEDWHTIEPMLLIPSVENAFKHGTGLLLQPEMDIRLSVANYHLHFSVRNRYEETTAVKDKTSGIGLPNVSRRLELLYPDKHELIVHKKDGWFSIDLDLTLT